MKKDNIYSSPQKQIKQFVFDDSVAAVFEDMIERSVPGYRDIAAMIGVLAEQYAQVGSHCYDLGCSLGTVSMILAGAISPKDCKVIAVDNSEAMAARCSENLEKIKSEVTTEVLCADIQDVKIEKASMVILNFTLQFIEPTARLALLKRVYEGMLEGGILIISEKISFEAEAEQDFQINLHQAFKKMHGYSDLEISQKRTALENVLIPETREHHLQRLEKAGFKECHLWFQCFNFASFLAIK